MVNLTHRIDIWSNGAITPDPSTEFHFWVMPEYLLPKHPHYPIRQAASDLSGAPDVFRTGHFKNPESYRSAPMGEEWQKFNADLMSLARFGKSFLELTDSQKGFIGEAFTSTFGNQTAFCNRTGFEG